MAGAPAVAAPSQAAIDAVVAQLVAQGYSGEIRIRPSGDTLVVEATGAAGQTERVYSGDGSRLFEEQSRSSKGTSVEREFDAVGVSVSDVGLRRPTLDDVFLTLTGHTAEGAADADGQTHVETQPTTEPEEVLA